MAISGGDGSIVLTTKVDESGLSSGLSKLKSGVGAFGKAFAVAGAAGVAAFAGITKAAVDSYSEFEQLKGGVQKIFDEIDYSKIAADAGEAYKTMGMSANEYLGVMTTVGANFASTLGDAKGYEVAKQGMQAISDFASGTGRSVDELSEKYQMITKSTSSYQSIADQFAGILPATSADFLEQAQAAGFLSDSYTKLTEVPMAEYQEAVTQMLSKGVDALGLTGNTAMEAATTLSGSTAMMKASWQNLLTGMADPTQNFDALLQNFISSIGAFAGNLLPVIQTATQGVLQMVQGLLPQLASMITQMLPMVVDGVVGIVNGIVQVAPQIVEAIVGLLPQLLTATTNLITQIATALPALMQVIVSALPTIIQSIVAALPTMIPALINGIVQAMVILIAALPQIIQPIIDNLPMIITTISGALISNLPILIQGAVQLVVALVAALPQIISGLLSAMGQVAVQIGQALFNALPGPVQEAFKAAFDAIKAIWDLVSPYFEMVWGNIKAVFSVVGAVLSGYFKVAWELIKATWNTVTSYFKAIWDTIKGVFSVVASVLSGNWSDAWGAIKGIVNTWAGFFRGVWNNIKQVFSSVSTYFSNIFNAAVNAIKTVFNNIVSFFTGIWTNIKNVFSNAASEFFSVGSNIVQGIINGVSSAASSLYNSLKNLAKNALNAAKNALGIQSPSREFRDEVGKMIPAGMAIGIDKAKNLVTRAVKSLVTDTRSEVQKVLDDMNKKMLESEEKYAEESIRLKESTSEADKEYLENLKETAEKERKIYDARQKDIQNSQKTIVETYEKSANDILDSIEDLRKKQESLADKLFGFGDVMESAEKVEDKFSKVHSVIKGEKGIYDLENLRTQTNELERYYDLMLKLKSREGMPSELFDVVKNMNFEESFAYAKGLMNMGSKQFSVYIKDWQKKQETSKRISEELFGEDGSASATKVLSDLSQQTNVLKDYYSLLNEVKNRGDVPQEFFSTLRDMGIEEGLEYANALLELSDEDFANYIKAWEEKQKTSQLISKELYKDEAQQLAVEIGDKFDEVEKEFFSVGENAANEFEDGFIDQLKEVVTNIKVTIASVFNGIMPAFDSEISGYSINVPALAKGSVLPGGKPFLALVNDQPRGQTNVEAPLQTIVDAMNIALNNRGSNEVVREEHYHLNETELMTILHKLVKGGERIQGKSLISGGAY